MHECRVCIYECACMNLGAWKRLGAWVFRSERTRLSVCEYESECASMRKRVCTHMCMCGCLYICTRLYLQVGVYMRMHVHMYGCVPAWASVSMQVWCTWVRRVHVTMRQLKTALLNKKKLRKIQVKNKLFYLYKFTISYLQWVCLMQFSFELAPIVACSETMSKNFSTSKYKNWTKNPKTWKLLSTKSRLASYPYYKYTVSYLQLIYLMWFSLGIASTAALSEAMSKKSQVQSPKNKLKFTKLENCGWQKCRVVCFYYYKYTYYFISAISLVWSSFEVALYRSWFCIKSTN